MPRRKPAASASKVLAFARTVLTSESQAIASLRPKLGADFVRAVAALDACKNKVVCTGLGKPGFIAQKLSATLASIGVPSLYLHPTEALHGDIGRVSKDDLVITLSNSGATDEVLELIVPLRRLGVTIIALTGDRASPLGQRADIVLEIGRIDEACPMGLVPTASTAALHALADALAMTLSHQREFSPQDYALLHPAGKLGRSVMRVAEVMRAGERNPKVHRKTKLSAVVLVMTNTPGRPGAANVVDDQGRLIGIFTDGDLRRLAEGKRLNFRVPVEKVMTRQPRCIGPEDLVLGAMALMREAQIDQLPVIDAEGLSVGLLDVQDLLAARLV